MIRLAVIVLVLAACAVSSVRAADMNFYLKNRRHHAVAVELFGQDRQVVWPGGGQAYFLDAREKKSVPVSCMAGERICFGAWKVGDDRVVFGVGPDNDRPPCEYCCFPCVDKSTKDISISRPAGSD